MIDPRNVIKFDRTQQELEEHLLFCLVVAGKTASTQARLLNSFVDSLPPGISPFDRIQKSIDNNVLLEKLKASKLGQYNRLFGAFIEILKLNLTKCEIKDLESIKGIGPKTSRMFILQTRENQKLAVLDTHILKYLASQGYVVPTSTPTSRMQYINLEKIFLELAKKSNMSASEFDLEIWKSYQKQNKKIKK